MPTVKDLTVEELRLLIGQVVEDKLHELLGDPDEGLNLRADVKERLRKSVGQPPNSRKTLDAAEVARRLGMEW